MTSAIFSVIPFLLEGTYITYVFLLLLGFGWLYSLIRG